MSSTALDDGVVDGRDGVIAVMPPTLANKIAAGEVVQRPASVVKELVENAIDAGSTQVDIVLKDAGSGLIQITDNGTGMSPADASTCFLRHATSKIRSVEDLETIGTLGFRGEALASIASVSQIELRTRRRTDEVGTLVRMDGGDSPRIEPAAAQPGTSISVRTLFYNVPARRNFLKRPQTELKHGVDVAHVMALSWPAVGFSLEHDGHELLNVRPQPDVPFFEALQNRARELSSVRESDALMEVEESTSYLTVRGVLGSPDAFRKSRGQQYLFVNGRYVKHRYLEHAVLSAYEYLLPEDTYPFFVLFLDIDPRHVDVNVHPTKAEVKFDDERGVYGMLRAVVRRAINSANMTPELSEGTPRLDIDLGFNQRHGGTRAARDWVDREHPGHSVRGAGVAGGGRRVDSVDLYGSGSPGSVPTPGQSSSRSMAPTFDLSDGHGAEGVAGARSEGRSGGAAAGDSRSPAQLLWQLHGAYILTQIRSGLVIIDQQAAHERVLYEQSRNTLREGMGMSQQLLFPQTLTLSPSDLALLEELRADLQRLGFEIEPFGGRSILVRGVPADIRAGDEKSILGDVLDAFVAQDNMDDRSERLARAIARKSAVKAGVPLNEKEMRALIDQLFQCDDPFTSPTGRPTIVKLSVDELRERFERP